MQIQINIYVIPYIVALVITIPFAIALPRFKPSEDLNITSALFIACVAWVACYVFVMINTSLIIKIIFSFIMVLASAAVNVVIFLLSAKLAGFTRLLKKDMLIYLSIIPAIHLLSYIIHIISRLINNNLTIRPNGLFEETQRSFFYTINNIGAGYYYILLISSLVFLILILVGRQKYFRRQAIIILSSVFVGIILSLLYLFKIIPMFGSLVPAAMSIGWVIYWIFGYRYLKAGEIIPINYEKIVENIKDCAIVLNKDKKIIFLNNSAQSLFKAVNDFVGKPIYDFFPNYKYFEEAMPNGKMDTIIKTSDGNRHFDMNTSTIRRGKTEIAGELIILRDITERKEYENKIKYMSFHDYLTGLYNRAFFDEELTRLDDSRNLPLSIVMGDVNGLKMTNDAYGHDKGDELLIKMAGILKQCFRKSDIISRWGGDEFITLLPATEYSTAEEIVKRIKIACLSISVENMPVSISLGISTKASPEQDIAYVIKDAEDKMYENKTDSERRTHSTIISSIKQSLIKKEYETEKNMKMMENLSLQVGKDLGLSEVELNELTILSALHDIGKITIPEDILLKPGNLTPEEWAIIKKHPEAGYRIAKSSIDIAAVADAILTHHENWDGSGYPKGLKNGEIPRLSRIISIVDSYNAMISDRPYRKAMNKMEAIEEIKKYSGIKYDPKIVETFLRLMTENRIL
jgi:diguanylate cyclase (GGDEF)-like protein/PAS domain S-box-containing protein